MPIYTEAQRLVIKAYVLADPILVTKAKGLDTDYGFILNALNLNYNPDFTVWKTVTMEREIQLDPGFDWKRVDNLSIGKARIWEWLFKLTGYIDPSQSNVRAGIDAIWTGAPVDLAVLAVVYTHCKRLATVTEKLFAVGTGSNAVPAVAVFVGQIGINDIGSILA